MTTEEELARLKKKVAKRKRASKGLFLLMVGLVFGMCLGLMVNVNASHDYYEVKPTIDSDPTHQDDYKMEQQYGYIKVILRCGYNTLSPNFILKNEDANISKSFSISPDGFYQGEFVPGNYSVYPPDGNGGQPEPIQYLTVNPQKTSYAVFLGHAISQPGKKVEIKKPTPTPTGTPSCHWHEGHWERKCIGSGHHRFCFDIWIPGYWDCGGCFD